jgi:hypothetical protein
VIPVARRPPPCPECDECDVLAITTTDDVGLERPECGAAIDADV